MRHLVASLLCIALLVLMVAIFGAILGGMFRDFATGRPFDPATVTAMFSPLLYRKVLIAFVVASGFAMLDIQAIASREEDAPGFEQKPKNKPLHFAAVRARRYLLPIVVMLYLGLVSRLLIGSEHVRNFLIDYDYYIFASVFLVARRPLKSTVAETIIHVLDLIAGGARAFARGGRH